jgi:hypothetical protein
MSIAYYSKNKDTFIANTKDANMQQLYSLVLPFLNPNANVLGWVVIVVSFYQKGLMFLPLMEAPRLSIIVLHF